MKFKVSFQLLPNRFCICWVLDVWALNEIWQNLVFGQISLPFLCVKSGILQAIYISFACSFSGSVHQLEKLLSQHFQKHNTNCEVWDFSELNTICNNLLSSVLSLSRALSFTITHRIHRFIPCKKYLTFRSLSCNRILNGIGQYKPRGLKLMLHPRHIYHKEM